MVYYALDLMRRPQQIVDVVERAKAAYPAGRDKRWCFLLDEVSTVGDWQRGIKYLRDNTSAAEDCFVVGLQDTLTIRNALGRGLVLSRHDLNPIPFK